MRPVLGHRYVLEDLLAHGGMSSVHRAFDLLEGRPVAVKVVRSGRRGGASTTSRGSALRQASGSSGAGSEEATTRVADTPAPTLTLATSPSLSAEDVAFRQALASEFRVLASLRHPNVISVLDYGFDDQGRPFLVLELLDGGRGLQDHAAGLSTAAAKIGLVAQILQALRYLHRRGIVHRDLKPSNVVVVGDRVKVLDFGIAVPPDEDISEIARRRLVGTVAYMAPELVRGAAGPTAATDLYAVGVILYELLTGRRPFPERSDQELLNAILRREPELEHPDLPAELRPLIASLLAKDPAARPVDAEEVGRRLCALCGALPPEETPEIRDSFFEAAAFVGRRRELELLEQRLAGALAGHGCVVLLGGESGVGKTRLLEELRNQALVKGVPVVVGQAVSDGSQPYDVWRPLLRRLCLGSPPESEAAGVLLPIVPELPRWMGTPIERAPELDGPAARARLQRVTRSLLQRLDAPLLLVLEDLQWSRAESVALLDRLAPAIRGLPLLVVASYRSDEVHLEHSVAHDELVQLARLERPQIHALVASMLGAAGRDPEVASYFERETEGNTFFLVECARALAESSGGMDGIGARALPQNLVARGIEDLLESRLSRLPPDARAGLDAAAVYGRVVDPAFLEQGGLLSTTGESWTRACAERSIIEAHGERWRFSHDKLREHVLRRLAEPRRLSLHRSIATALERRVGDAYADERELLAHHWSEAARSGEELSIASAVLWLERAAEASLAVHANSRAAQTLRRLLDLTANASEPAAPAARGRWHRLLGQAQRAMGELELSRLNLERANADLGGSTPASRPRRLLALAGAGARQAWLMKRGAARNRGIPTLAENDRLLEQATINSLLSEIYFFANEPELTMLSILRSANLTQAAQRSKLLPPAYASMAILCGLLGWAGIARRYVDRALASAQELGDPATEATVCGRLGVHLISAGAWQELEHTAQRGADLCRQLGNSSAYCDCIALLAFAAGYRDEYDRSLSLWSGLADVAAANDHQQQTTWAHYGIATALLRRGELIEAADRLRAAEACFAADTERTIRIIVGGLRAGVQWRSGVPSALEAALDNLTQVAGIERPTNFSLLLGITETAEVLFSAAETRLSEAAPAVQLPAAQRAAVRRIHGSLQAYARAFPVGKPAAQLFAGRLAALDARPRRARRELHRAARLSRGASMPYFEARALELLAPIDSAMAEGFDSDAARIYRRLGCRADLERARGENIHAEGAP